MKFLLLAVAVILPLSACTEQAEKQAGQTDSKVAEQSIDFTKADPTRPAVLPANLTAATTCSFDRINGAGREVLNQIADKSKVQLNGWVANVSATTTPGDVILEFEGATKFYVKGMRGLKRPDVAASFKNPVLVDAGWEANVDISAAAAGQYKLRIIQIEGQTATVCDPNGVIVIAG